MIRSVLGCPAARPLNAAGASSRPGSLGRVPEPGRRWNRCVLPGAPAIAVSRHAPISMGYAVDIDDGYIPSLWVRFRLQQSLVGTLGHVGE